MPVNDIKWKPNYTTAIRECAVNAMEYQCLKMQAFIARETGRWIWRVCGIKIYRGSRTEGGVVLGHSQELSVRIINVSAGRSVKK